MDTTLRYFALNKTSDIVWAHAVNNQEYLERSLADPNIHMIEADVLLSKDGQVIMAHPPAVQSNLMFSDFIIGVCMHNQIHPERPKGVKLDFKVPVVVGKYICTILHIRTRICCDYFIFLKVIYCYCDRTPKHARNCPL